MISEKEKAKKIQQILNKIYPKAPIPLKHRNKFTLLTSVLLDKFYLRFVVFF